MDIVRVQDVGLCGASDPEVLEWTANENRVLLTHDVSTITRYAIDRIQAGRPMPGVFEVDDGARMSRVLEDILLLAELSEERECEGQIGYIPLK